MKMKMKMNMKLLINQIINITIGLFILKNKVLAIGTECFNLITRYIPKNVFNLNLNIYEVIVKNIQLKIIIATMNINIKQILRLRFIIILSLKPLALTIIINYTNRYTFTLYFFTLNNLINYLFSITSLVVQVIPRIILIMKSNDTISNKLTYNPYFYNYKVSMTRNLLTFKPSTIRAWGLKKLSVSYSTANNKQIGNWIAGLVDAEGCFMIAITKNSRYLGDCYDPSLYSLTNQPNKSLVKGQKAMPLWVRLVFKLKLHIKDKSLIDLLISELGVGYYDPSTKEGQEREGQVGISVTSFEDIKIIILFFEKYPLITQKCVDYLYFKQVYALIANKEHLTLEGLTKIASIKALSNWGLNTQLALAFPNASSNKRISVNNKISSHPSGAEWISGFTTGDGSFQIRITNSSKYRHGVEIGLKYEVTQHQKDKALMQNLCDYFKCGKVGVRKDIVDFRVTALKDILNIIIPFFKTYPVAGAKLVDFNKFCEVAEIMKNKEHLTQEGIEKVKLIKSRDN